MTLSGGPIFWILVIMAISAVFMFFERLIEFRRAHINPEDFVKGVINVLEQGNVEEALSICEDTDVPVAAVVASAVRHRASPGRILREAVEATARGEKSRLERRLAALRIMGDIAPAVGLLGTFFGFIGAVMKVNSEELVLRADLINATMTALVSAALGLMVAIPVVVMYGMLKTRMDRLFVEIDTVASRIVGYISAKAVQK
ncbi:MAG: MotA/TolQ/ExbB proton channel family protein [Kiritimatiellae bacterium]|nr:MotA/TolQ/ExbB proton channel family protein [Kiritimatiellia bacterium]